MIQEKRIDDYWNVDENKSLSDSWTGFTKFTLLKETSKRIYVVWWETDKNSNNHSTRSYLARSRRKKNRNEQSRSQKLVNASNLSGIYSIDPNDDEYNHIIKNARKKLETPMADPMPCRRAQSSSVTGAVNLKRAKASEKFQKMKFDCIVEVHESKRPRMESVKKRNHEDHIVGKGDNSISHYNWCTNLFLCRM